MQDLMELARQNPMWVIAWAGLLVAVIFMTVKMSFSKVKEISRTEATNLINNQQAVVVDVRSHEAFRSGHIVDAMNVTVPEIEGDNVGQLEKSKSLPVIVVCENGTTSSRKAAEKLTKLGFEQVYMLKDGVMGWNSDNLPLVRNKGK